MQVYKFSKPTVLANQQQGKHFPMFTIEQEEKLKQGIKEMHPDKTPQERFQIAQEYVKSRTSTTPTSEVKPYEDTSFMGAVKGFAKDRTESIQDAQIRSAKGEQTGIETQLQKAGEGIGFVSDVMGETMVRSAKGVWNMLPNFLKEGATDAAKKIIEQPIVQKGIEMIGNGVEAYDTRAKENPRADANLRSVYNIGEMLANFAGGKIVGETVKKGGKETLEVAGEVASAVTKPIGNAVEKTTTGLLGLTTGTSPDTIRTALKTAGTDDFLKGLRGQVDNTDILDNVNYAMKSLKDSRRKLYGEAYDRLLDNTTQIDINDVADDFFEKLAGKGGFGVTVANKGDDIALDFSRSTISRGSGQEKVINDIMQDLKTWATDGDFSPASMDVLKKRIGDYFKGSADFSQTDMLVTNLEKKIASKITDAVPEYAAMNAKYNELSNLIRDVSGALSLGGNKQTTSAITKIQGVLRRNQEFRQLMVNEIQKYAKGDILAQIAGASLSDWMPRGLAGVVTAGTTLINPSFLAGFAAASPRIVGELANVVGVTVKTLKGAIDNAKKFVNALPTSNIPDAFPIDISTAVGSVSDSVNSLDNQK